MTDPTIIPTEQFIVQADEQNMRIDKMLAGKMPALSRTRIQWLQEHRHIMLNHAPLASASYKVRVGDVVTVALPQAELTTVEAVPMPLDIVFEDAALLVINKAAGLTVHPAAGHVNDTLVNGLLAHCGDTLSAIGGEARPGIVHRLDKDTSGLMVVAKTDVAHRHLAAQLADRSLSRTYQALAWGVPAPPAGKVDAPIDRHPQNRKKMAVVEGGRNAVTRYRVLSAYAGGQLSLLQCKLETGRTHQIRVHMAHIGHPLIGDPVYSGRRTGSVRKLPAEAAEAIRAFPRQALHASMIGFVHPETKKPMEFSVDIAADIQTLLTALSL